MNKIVRTILVGCSIVIIICLAWFGEHRKFYCIGNDQCITVWKTYNNTCYIIPGKYYSILKPSDNYIQTTNIDNVDVIWKDKRDILVSCENCTITNKNINEIKIEDYNLKKSTNDSLYLYFDGTYNRYKKNVKYVSLFIKEGYAKAPNISSKKL